MSIPAGITRHGYLGSNGVVYFKNAKTGRRFYGNKSVSLKSLNNVSNGIKKISRGLNYASWGFEEYNAYIADGYGFGENMKRTSSIITARALGTKIGMTIGSYAGTVLGGMVGGSVSYGIGTIPMATFGEISGSMIGAYLGNEAGAIVGNLLYDYYY